VGNRGNIPINTRIDNTVSMSGSIMRKKLNTIFTRATRRARMNMTYTEGVRLFTKDRESSYDGSSGRFVDNVRSTRFGGLHGGFSGALYNEPF
jgi:hypothetical protein